MKNTFVMVYSVTVIFLVMESVFACVPISHFFDSNQVLPMRTWRAYYWNNILGEVSNLKDSLPLKLNDKTKKKIVVLGDSFTFGSGLKKIEHRYTNLLSNQIENNYKVINYSQVGSDTRQQLYMLKGIPPQDIDMLVLQYFQNDIEYLISKKIKKLRIKDGKTDNFFIKNSYFINFLYYYFYLPLQSDDTHYVDYIKDAYQDSHLIKKHVSHLNQFIEYSRELSIPLIVITIPFLNDTGSDTQATLQPIESHFAQNKIPVVKVFDLIQDMPVPKRIINRYNAHPSELLHQLIAKELLREIEIQLK